ncbi:hypothetical protein LIX60_06725 [Streptomyces sp. S07_1.15]|uniref:hypothetical protein n=1 Tax=Streptomyces sp. S07_1.15 TaxID=2873925 RepID=UPI001D14DDAC|nr:hypothetical protein [Streptomyces sp. S07_1.15]MCC3651173.1 hypothetical protein [Streptomyces sp. S07_1.15]
MKLNRETEDDEEICRICGYTEGDLLWEGGWPNYIICPCCGTESGIGDAGNPDSWEGLQGIRNSRGYWIGNGAQWSSPSLKPKSWDLLRQLAQLPPEWR